MGCTVEVSGGKQPSPSLANDREQNRQKMTIDFHPPTLRRSIDPVVSKLVP